MQIPKILFPAAAGAAIERIAMPGDAGYVGAAVGAGVYYVKPDLLPGELLILGGAAGAGYLVGEMAGFSPLIGAAGLGALAYWRWSRAQATGAYDASSVAQQMNAINSAMSSIPV